MSRYEIGFRPGVGGRSAGGASQINRVTDRAREVAIGLINAALRVLAKVCISRARNAALREFMQQKPRVTVRPSQSLPRRRGLPNLR
ncbi:hypothetical protein [Nevskia sp.]|uniref:hypothetical protein n=1 Tax=Nevskia sp. TaxID=1929292 RepID=UPI0025EDB6CE|nr:hypothetical protein [Nevskia sp.]